MNDIKWITLKFVMIGESNVGKSSLILRYAKDKFDSNPTVTLGVAFNSKMMIIDEKYVKLAIWDTSGLERFRTVIGSYYRGAQGIILVYDVNNRETFQKLDSWLHELEIYGARPNVVKMVVANKIDLQRREVTREEGFEFAKRHRAMFLETSAKTKEAFEEVEEAFKEVAAKILKTDSLWEPEHKNGVDLKSNETTASSCNC